MNYEDFVVPPGKKVLLKDYDSGFTAKFKMEEDAQNKLQKDIKRLAKYQDILYSNKTYAVLIIIQAMDAAGKDGTIKHVMSGVNPQGCEVFSFKAPSAEELEHDFLWRCAKALPERGRIGIFNRSYYEEVLVVRVHPELLQRQQLPSPAKGNKLWRHRYEAINNFERYLVRNGIVIVKFFLHLSREEQKSRFLQRLTTPEKNWKFSESDVKERARWDDYMKAYEEMFQYTSSRWAPWHIIPADQKWFTRTAVADILVGKLKSLKLRYPTVSKEHRQDLRKAKELLENE